ncbi:MAG TPA: hypothetical protein VGC11_03040 [Acidimicrobiia bacterium]|jgi:hypothetical protein
MSTTGWIILIVVLILVFGGGFGWSRRRWVGQRTRTAVQSGPVAPGARIDEEPDRWFGIPVRCEPFGPRTT